MMNKPMVLSPREVGHLNRAKVLRSLTDHGPQSRSDLARSAGVARASMGTIVQGLIDDGILAEQRPTEGRGVGKPARPLWFAEGAGAVIAVEVRREVVRAAVIDARGDMGPVTEASLTDPASAPTVAAAARRAAAGAGSGASAIGVGVAVPGACDVDAGVVLGSTQVPGASGAQLAQTLAKATGLPVLVENDSRAQAMAEHWFGDGRRQSSFVSLQTGDGIGAGFVLGGTLQRGSGGWGGEVGHAPVVLDGDRCPCGLRGCWETIASLRWLRRRAADLELPGARAITCRDLSELTQNGDRGAAALLDEYADNLGVGLGMLAQMLDPELFVLHGDVVSGGEAFHQILADAAGARSLRSVEIVFSMLPEATLCGAAATVLTEHLHRAIA